MGIFGRKRKREQEQEQPSGGGIDIGGGMRVHLEVSPEQMRQLTDQARQAAEAGDVKAMFHLAGFLEHQGKVQEAANWHHRASSAGNADSAAWLADRLLKQGQTEQGLDYLRLAAQLGHVSATFNLAVLLLGENSEDYEGARWMLRAAEAGHQKAIDYLGINIEEVRKARAAVERDIAKAEQGDVAAAHRAAVGLIDLVEDEQADHWLEVGARGGNADSAYELAQRLRDGGETERALELMKQAGQLGRKDATRVAGVWLYTDGDPAAAVPLLRQAVADGEELVVPILGAALAAAGDLDGAEAVMRPAAEAGDWQAQYNLLSVLQQQAARAGTQPSPEEQELLIRASEGVHDAAQERLDAGRPDQAVHMLRIAARAGDPVAQRSLGKLLLAMNPKDPEGREWKQRADSVLGR
ncbi:tetratricopeptide repeat protein [Kitasatospora sp. SUK 42]|uniref:tetratricopeptide repeat protein n=1 Tax=Kitasatospora sp. SUK 42 TaxID=1588882 RepID=UPI0018C9D475|nr:tetratricopeptide repeat protein [Kitasatospora sp. SUK 42]MBV2156490.1 sel1 repeat family protein [Kitasatospora sp. SUK 42]